MGGCPKMKGGSSSGGPLLGAIFRFGGREAKCQTVPRSVAEVVELGRRALGGEHLFPSTEPSPQVFGAIPQRKTTSTSLSSSSSSSSRTPGGGPPPLPLGQTPRQQQYALSTEADLEAYLQRVALCALYAEFWLRPAPTMALTPRRPVSAPSSESAKKPAPEKPPLPPAPAPSTPCKEAAPPAPVEQVCLPPDPGVALEAESGDVLVTEETVLVVSITPEGQRELRKALRNTWAGEVLKSPSRQQNVIKAN